ncbi:MAG: SRPBCC family protein [Methylocella sp.]
MTEPSAKQASTQVSKIIKAPRKAVYQAFLDPDAVASWRAPDNMKGQVHVFDAREGGMFRMSLTYQDPDHSPGGKTSEDTDTFHGRFIELVPYEKIVEVIEFESRNPIFGGEMKITTSFADTDQGTEITVLCQDIPAGIRPEDNEMGCNSSLQNLATLIE